MKSNASTPWFFLAPNMIVILLFKPAGLLGRLGPSADATSTGRD